MGSHGGSASHACRPEHTRCAGCTATARTGPPGAEKRQAPCAGEAPAPKETAFRRKVLSAGGRAELVRCLRRSPGVGSFPGTLSCSLSLGASDAGGGGRAGGEGLPPPPPTSPRPSPGAAGGADASGAAGPHPSWHGPLPRHHVPFCFPGPTTPAVAGGCRLFVSQDYAAGNPQFYAAFVNYRAAFDECPRLPRGSLAAVRDGKCSRRRCPRLCFHTPGRRPCWKVNLTLSFLPH